MATAATSPRPGPRRRRRNAEETRDLLLQAGASLVLDSLAADQASDGGPLAHIRVQDVVREASRNQETALTTGAIYNIWPTQSDFQVDLMFHILKEGMFPGADPVLRLAGELFAQRLPFELIGHRLSDEAFRIDVESPVARATAAFSALAGVPAIREALRAAHGTLLESNRILYSQLLTYSGLRIREPYTLDQLITVLDALAGGLASKYFIVPEEFEVPEGETSIVALASEGAFQAFCEPNEGN